MTTTDTGTHTATASSTASAPPPTAGDVTLPVTTGAVPPLPPGTTPPVSFAQERMWFVEQLQPGTAAYVLRVAVRLRGRLDLDALRLSLDDLAERHDSLRMCFPSHVDGQAQVRVEERVSVPLTVVELEPLPEARARAHASSLVTADCGPFDLTRAPLARAMVVRLAEDDHVLHLAAHHIISDGWSRPVLIGDWAALYAARLGLAPPLPALPVSYGDFSAWHRERLAAPDAVADLDWWRDALAGVPPLDLPVDRPRPPEMTVAGRLQHLRIGANLAADLRELARSHRASLFVTMLAALHATLHRWSGQTDFAVGSPVAGRERPELEGIVGLFVNVLPLRATIDPRMPFTHLLAQTRDRVLEALGHQEVPFERVVQELNVDRDTSRTPVFQVLFSMHNALGPGRDWPEGLLESPFPAEVSSSKHDLSIFVDEVDHGLRAELIYRTDLFDDETIDRLAQAYRRVLDSVVRQPDQPLADLDLADDLEQSTVLAWSVGPAAPAAVLPDLRPDRGLLCDVIDTHVATTPHAPAVVCADEVLTYQELSDHAHRVAHWLGDRGVAPGSIVGVCLPQSEWLAAVLLGIGKAGCAYLPLDVEHPPARLAAIVDDARPALIIADDEVVLPADPPVARWREVRPRLDRYDPTAPLPPAHPLDLAYVIYTSGSTGTPKGVAVAHRQIRRYLGGVAGRFGVVAGARWALPQSLAFDFAMTVFYVGIATGGSVHLVPRRCTGQELAEYLRRWEIDYVKMTPSHLAALANEVELVDLAPRRAVILGGEASGLDWASALGARGAQVFNHYGPTEATVGIATFEVPPAGGPGPNALAARPGPNALAARPGPNALAARPGPTPTGRPLPEARIYVLDGQLRPTPIGVTGEIYLGGDRLARGYLGRPALTAQAFRPDPFSDQPGARMYATGDLGRWRNDGQLEFQGRRDGQVKLRGYRIELGEVEARLRETPGVSAAVAVLREDRLVAYLQRTPGEADLEPAGLRGLLARTLPEYMIPNVFVWLDRLPLQEHGKVDRRALPAPTAAPSTREHVEPSGAAEVAIAGVWAQVLGLDQVGALDDFFVLGGHSLLATQVVARLRRVLGPSTSLTVMDLFRLRTVRELARLVDAGGSAGTLLHELTRPSTQDTIRTYVCVPYGGANAVVFQPLADAMPDGHRLLAVSPPGHDIGLEEAVQPIEVTAQRCVDEILQSVRGPLVLYGHCGPGGALAVEISRRLEAAGRELKAVYLGGIFPFARPTKGLAGQLFRWRVAERLRGDRVYANWLQGMGADVGALDEGERRFLIRAMRHDARLAEEYFTRLLHEQVRPLRAPIISVVGERDPGTEFYRERYREWAFLSPTTALVALAEGGHYFPRFRAQELADIIVGVDGKLDTPVAVPDPAVATGRLASSPDVATGRLASSPDVSWNLVAATHSGPTAGTASGVATDGRSEPQPGMRRFTAVAAGQLVSATGSALTEFAVPLWIYLETGSLLRFALFAVLAQIPGILAAPLAGAWIDRANRRTAMLASDITAGTAIAAFAALFFSGQLLDWHIYTFVGVLSIALTCQRLAYMSAVPQLVPKQYLGHANGAVQLSGGVAQFLVPLLAVGLVATIGLGGILLVDLGSYLVAIVTVALVRFPRTMPWVRRESLMAEITGGLRYTVHHPGFRAMVLFFAAFNLFLAPLYLLLSPLVLGFGSLDSVAKVALAGGAGAVVGSLAMMMWGGPRQRRMYGMLLACLAFAVAGALTGLRPSLAVAALGSFAMSLALAIVNGIWLTIIQTKVPQRLHARVIALNMIIALSTLPIGQAVLVPLVVPALEPMLMPGGSLAGTVGTVLGVGPGRGTGLLFVLCGLAIAIAVLVSLRLPRLARFDAEVPDAPPDDLVGLRSWQERTATRASESKQ